MKQLLLVITICTITFTFAQSKQKPKNDARFSLKPETLIGTKIPDLKAHNTQGDLIKIKDIQQGKYLLLASGCLTCPHFHRDYPAIEAAFADYSNKNMAFFYFYKSLRHPELNGYVESQNISERLLHIEVAQKKLQTKVPWISDTMDDEMKTALHSNSESVYLMSPEGTILYASSHINEVELRSALEKFIGPVKNKTTISSLNLPRIKRSILPENITDDWQVERPTNLKILTIIPDHPAETYYVKLRAEADASLINNGEGKLFLSFFPDPIYDAHWNNLVPPMKYSLTLPNGVRATPSEATAKEGAEDSDTKPRQFLVDIKNAKAGDKIKISLHYFGCTPTMCKAMTHDYTITLTAEDRGAITAGFNKNRNNTGNRRPARR
ncbi:redoxin domain-containing protein [Mariniflexile sp. AS56]|uniref:redoxin domain-containing protein n=1 Tax=Mariniflexile sp. AS56 TaxID=3063957 RepID=UPI0026EBA283|nr:redoxin domain-containing protein [Mariniflexile sp. AS56]MDO7172299.1 redoxin domain-containing protein [Mariniflexile sp. AS56]